MKQFHKSIFLLYKKTFETLFIFFLVLKFSILIISCSGVPKSTFHNSYYSPDYEDKSFSDVSMDICILKNEYTYDAELDSGMISGMIYFDDLFVKYFPEGIKMFSSTTKTGWIFYDVNYEIFPILYDGISEDGRTLYSVSMPDSLTLFQKQSTSDFLFIVHFFSFVGNRPEQSETHSPGTKDYESVITINYSIWRTKNSDLVVKDIVRTRMKFKNLVDKWPFRGVVLKAASEIFEKLPMFSK